MKMKRRLMFSMLFLFTLSPLRSEEIPDLLELLGELLPEVSIHDEQWKVIEEARSKPLRKLQDSRIVFESQNGEFVSLQLQRVEGVLRPPFYKGGPWTEGTIGTFPGGHLNSTEPVLAVTGSVQLTELTDNTPALAYTTYWCPDKKNRVLISHGYSMAVGPFRVLLQHTSDRVITPEFVAELAHFLIKRIGEQDGADQPAAALESKSEGKEKSKPESEVRPQ